MALPTVIMPCLSLLVWAQISMLEEQALLLWVVRVPGSSLDRLAAAESRPLGPKIIKQLI